VGHRSKNCRVALWLQWLLTRCNARNYAAVGFKTLFRMESATARTAVRILRMLPRERITRALGHLTDVRVPRPLLRRILGLYARKYRVDMSESELTIEEFETFNEFFTRKLREGMRPIDQTPFSVASPADGRLDDAGPIDENQIFSVKGQPYDAGELLGSPEEARGFAGGYYAIVYLSPRDYHRVHAPIEGRVEAIRHIPGTLFPVNELGVTYVPNLFARNERVVINLGSSIFGRVSVVMVGAMIVGRITTTLAGPPRPPLGGPMTEQVFSHNRQPLVTKGQDLGAFQLGSTVVLLFSPPKDQHTFHFERSKLGSAVRLGEALGILQSLGVRV